MNIGGWAFDNCTKLTSLTIPDSVTSIDSWAFYYCTGLTSVTIGNNVTSIGEETFRACYRLKNIEIPDSVTSIGDRAFGDCLDLTSITIPSSVTNIGSWAFEYCTDLKSIIVDKDNKVYDSRNNCNAVIKTETNELIYGCKNTVIPDSVTSIGNYAFNGCTTLTSITIPDSVKNIGYSAFDDCMGLTSITIPDSVTSIGNYAFSMCTNLTSITIPSNVTSIGYDAFYNCNNVTIYCYKDSCAHNYAIDNGINYILLDEEEHTHTLSHVVIPATCTVNGMEYDICSECGETFNNVVIPAAHKYNHVVEASTCTKTGKEYDKCTVCGAVANEKALPLKAHDYKHIVEESTCTKAGKEYDKCTVCGAVANEKTLPFKAHTWGEWVRTKEPTVDAEGVDTRECSVCHAKETRAVEKLNALIDENTGVQVVYDDEYSDGVKLEVEETFDGTSFQLINSNYGSVNTTIFDITTTKNGKKVQPDGKVTVRIPVPEGFSGGKIFAVYVDSVNGAVTTIPAKVVDGYVEFTVEHFSKYALCWENGKVNSVSINNDLELKYKDFAKLNPVINADSGVKYTVEYKSSDNSVATVDNNGNVYGAKSFIKKTATITCTVTDEYGNSVSDTANVTVGYAWWQWIIGIVLFGWIWY